MSQLLLNKEYFKDSLLEIAQKVEEERDYLSHLDSEIGDGDHGINLSIGFRGVKEQLDIIVEEAPDIDTILKKTGMILLSKVGGASGPLYGSFFMKMGADVKGKDEITFQEFADMINNGVKSIEHRGKAVLGDKTMVDALRPATDFLIAEKDNENPIDTFSTFVGKVSEGSDATIPMQAKKGRALRLNERSIGHRDPGSASSVMIMNVFLNQMKEL